MLYLCTRILLEIEPGSSIPRIPRILQGNDDEGYLLIPQQRREQGGIVLSKVNVAVACVDRIILQAPLLSFKIH